MANHKTFFLFIVLFFLPVRQCLISAPNESFGTDFQAIGVLHANNNKSEIESIASNLELKWRNLDPNQYAPMMVRLCGMLCLNDIGKNNELHKKYSEKAINHLGNAILEISVKNEMSLLLYATKSSEILASISKQENWFETREIIAKPYFRSLARLFSKIDPDWDINQSVSLSRLSQVPTEEQFKARKEYDEQFRLRQLKQNSLPEFQDYFNLLYSRSENDSVSFDIEAFNADLSKVVEDQKIKSQVIDIVLKSKDQLYTLGEEEEKIVSKDITEQLASMLEYQGITEMPQDEQMSSRIQSALTSARQFWKECQDLVNAKKIHLSSAYNVGYNGVWKPKGEKMGYNFFFKSAAMELNHCYKNTYEDEVGRNVIRDKRYELIFYPFGSNIKFYKHGASKEKIHFYFGNKIKMYILQIGNEEWYSISWDQNGKIVKEHTYTRRIGP